MQLKENFSGPTKASGRILGLDFGLRRVGYAVSDETQTVAFGRGVFSATPREKLLERIRALSVEENITRIVIGIALDEDNNETPISGHARALGHALARTLMLPISYIDEFGTSKEALSKIPFRKERRRKGAVDEIAAQIILQSYLDGNK